MRFIVVDLELLVGALKEPDESPVGRVLTLCAYSAAFDKLDVATDPRIRGWDHDTTRAVAVHDMLSTRLPDGAPNDWSLVLTTSMAQNALDELTRTSHEHEVSTRDAADALYQVLAGTWVPSEALTGWSGSHGSRRPQSGALQRLLAVAFGALSTVPALAPAHAYVVIPDTDDEPVRRRLHRRTRRIVKQPYQRGGGPYTFGSSRVDVVTLDDLVRHEAAASPPFDVEAIELRLFAELQALVSA